MHQMRISTNFKVYQLMLSLKKLEIRKKKKCENSERADKNQTESHGI
jgi:hypothetical protein